MTKTEIQPQKLGMKSHKIEEKSYAYSNLGLSLRVASLEHFFEDMHWYIGT